MALRVGGATPCSSRCLAGSGAPGALHSVPICPRPPGLAAGGAAGAGAEVDKSPSCASSSQASGSISPSSGQDPDSSSQTRRQRGSASGGSPGASRPRPLLHPRISRPPSAHTQCRAPRSLAETPEIVPTAPRATPSAQPPPGGAFKPEAGPEVNTATPFPQVLNGDLRPEKGKCASGQQGGREGWGAPAPRAALPRSAGLSSCPEANDVGTVGCEVGPLTVFFTSPHSLPGCHRPCDVGEPRPSRLHTAEPQGLPPGHSPHWAS